MFGCLLCIVENRVLRQEQIVMGTSGTILDWIMKKKVSLSFSLSLSLSPSLSLSLSLSLLCTFLPSPTTKVLLLLFNQVIDPQRITMFVLDEADVMIDQQGQQDQTIRIQK